MDNIVLEEDYEMFQRLRGLVVGKTWETSVWARTIEKAVDDLALFIKTIEIDERLSEEIWQHASSAYGFLFYEGHTVPFDDYYVDVYCDGCNDIWVEKIGAVLRIKISDTEDISREEIACPLCGKVTAVSALRYEISQDCNGKLKEVDLGTVLYMLGFKNVKRFREGTMREVRRRTNTRGKTLQIKREKKKQLERGYRINKPSKRRKANKSK